MTPTCCFIGCEREAEWRIDASNGRPDEYTESCTEHVGPLLADAAEHRIYRIAALAAAQETK